MSDPRPLIFAPIAGRTATAELRTDDDGVLCGVEHAVSAAIELGLTVQHSMTSGQALNRGDSILAVSGAPGAIALAEERLAGLIAKPSGIATAARRFVARTGGRPRIVSGAWKKLPFSQRDMIREAVTCGGANPRIAEWPFAYLDKNFVAMLGGVPAALAAVDAHPELAGHRRVVQVTDPADARVAAENGAHVIVVDTGRIADVPVAIDALHASGLRSQVELAFGGGVTLDDAAALADLDVDIVDVGRAIVDAPLVDVALRVTGVS